MEKPIKTERGWNITEIHKRYGNFIIDCIRLHGVKSAEDAADIRQDIYMALFKRSVQEKLPTGHSVKGYIFKATSNMVTDYRRTEIRESAVIDWVSNDAVRIAIKMDINSFKRWWSKNDDVHERILRAIEFLDGYEPTKGVSMRSVIESIYNGVTYDVIANQYGVSTGTVKAWVSRFRSSLRKHIQSPPTRD